MQSNLCCVQLDIAFITYTKSSNIIELIVSAYLQLIWLMRCENPRIHCVLYNPLQCYVRVKTIWWLYSSHISAQYSHVRLCCFSPTILKASVSCALKSTVYELCAFQIVLAYILITSVLCFLRVIATAALKSIARAIASCPALQFCYIVYAFHILLRSMSWGCVQGS